jgi:hypothetical protein
MKTSCFLSREASLASETSGRVPVMSEVQPSRPAPGAYVVRAPGGEPVTTYRRGRAGATKRHSYAARREIIRVALTDRHSQLSGRDRQPAAQDRFHAPEDDIASMEQFARGRGFQVVARTSFLNYTGSEFERLEPFLEMMEADPPTLDALIFANWERFSRGWQGLVVVERVRQAGGDLLFVDNPHLDIYDPRNELIISVLNGMASLVVANGRAKALQIKKKLAAAGRATASIWCYRKLERAKEITLADGTSKRLPVGALEPDEAEFPFGTKAYDLLYGGMGDTEVARWLNEQGQRPRPVRRRDADGSIVQRGHEHWTANAVRAWRMNPINKGWIKHGDFINENAHPPVTTPEKWEAVNAPRVGSRTGASPRPALCLGIVRCQCCRSAITLKRDSAGEPLRYQCVYPSCQAGLAIEAKLIDPLVEAHLFSQLVANRRALQAQAISGKELDVARLRQAKEEALARQDRIRTNVALADENFDRYNALCDAAEREVQAAEKALLALIQTDQAQAMVRDAVEDWPTLSLSEKRRLLAAAYPLIWLRPVDNLDREGQLRRVTEPAERLWFIARGQEEEFLLPRKGQGFIAEAHAPVPWPDGSRPATYEERLARRSDISGDVPASACQEDLERWRGARRHFLAHGRTDEEVIEVSTRLATTAAARELGMSIAGMLKRLRKLGAAGLIAEDPRERRAQAQAARNEETLAAVARNNNNVAAAARELGVSPGAMYHRYRFARGQRRRARPAPATEE